MANQRRQMNKPTSLFNIATEGVVRRLKEKMKEWSESNRIADPTRVKMARLDGVVEGFNLCMQFLEYNKHKL